jgi:hypothetical protein
MPSLGTPPAPTPPAGLTCTDERLAVAYGAACRPDRFAGSGARQLPASSRAGAPERHSLAR